ncbi:MAG: response regulator [bacterium]
MSGAKKVLLIDDDVDLVEANKIVLEANGYTVLTAYNGEDGLRVAQQEVPDVIVLDVSMERKDEGFYVSQRIRNTPGIANTPILMVTAIHKCTKLRFSPNTDGEYLPVNEFLDKPVDPNLLVSLVEKWTKASNN